jgi:hypothetical protein
MTSPADFRAELGPTLSDADLEVLLVRARTHDEPELRALVKQHLALRRVAEWLVADATERRGAAAAAGHPMIALARFLTEPSAADDAGSGDGSGDAGGGATRE